jgi:hypothetical protein
VDTQFQTSNFFSDEFDIRSLSKLQEWHWVYWYSCVA